MTMKEHTRIELVEGGNIFKQGEHVKLSFEPRDYAGTIVDLTGKDIAVAIWNRKGIMYEGTALYDEDDQLIRMSVEETLQHGKYNIEFTATSAADPTYRQKFPSSEYEGIVDIKPSADNMDVVGVQMTTVTQLRNEQTVAQQTFEAEVLPRVQTVESQQAQLAADYQAAAGALTEDSEVILARGDKPTLGARLDDTAVKLADKVGGQRKLQPEEFSDEAYALLTGNGTVNVLSVPQKGSVTTDKISSSKLSPKVLQDVKSSSTRTANLFNRDAVKTGGYYDKTAGAWVDNPLYVSSEFIPVGLFTYDLSVRSTNIIKWNTSKQFMAGTSGTAISNATNPAAYITVSLLVEELDTMMVAKSGELPAVYVPYYKYGLSNSWDVLEGQEVKPLQVKGVKLSETPTVNVFNKAAVIPGGYYDGATGNWIANPSYVSSEFIPVENVTYSASYTTEVVKWNADKQFMAGGRTQNVGNAEGAAFMTFRVTTGTVDSMIIAKQSEFPAVYVPYRKNKFDDSWEILKPEYLDEKLNVLDVDGLRTNTEELRSMYSPQYNEPIELDLKDFSGYNQPIHPSVLYIPGGFNGFKYWLVQSPFPVAVIGRSDRWEVPIVYKSNDGIDWITVADPLDDLTESEIANGDYMSDPHLVYREDTATLEVWYRFTRQVDGLPTNVVRKTTQDAVSWTDREEMIPETLYTEPTFVRSPSILWNNDTKVYRFWYKSNAGLFYNQLPEGGTWNPNAQQPCTLDDNDSHWHIDVNFYNGQYHYLGYSVNDYITHYTSDDGFAFIKNKQILSKTDGNPLYSKALYKAASLLDEFGNVMVYFSTINSDSVRRMGLIVAESFDVMQASRKVSGGRVLLESGITLEELAEEFVKLKAQVDAMQ